MKYKFFLADFHDRNRLAIDGTVKPSHGCTPAYFDTPDEAYQHPAAAELTVHRCLAAETVPGGIDG
jgi:hypothetical protein